MKSENVLFNFTTGNGFVIGGGDVAATLMARDYKDPQCVVIKHESIEQSDNRNIMR